MHLDDFGKFIRELKDALKDLMERQESFRQSCVQVETYNARELETLRRKFEAELGVQREHVNKYMDKMAAAESALTQVCVCYGPHRKHHSSVHVLNHAVSMWNAKDMQVLGRTPMFAMQLDRCMSRIGCNRATAH